MAVPAHPIEYPARRVMNKPSGSEPAPNRKFLLN
jgi:hypothetical protein